MNKKIIFFLVLLLLFSILLIDYSYVQEEEKEGVSSFLSGNDYLDLADAYKIFYVIGLLDMWSYVAYSELPEIYPIFRRKFKDMSMQQVEAIFDRYLEEHPEEWHLSAASIFTGAIMEIILDN